MKNALRAFAVLAAGLAAFVFAAPQAAAATAATLPMSMKGAVADTALGAFVENARHTRRHIRRLCRRRWGGGLRYRRCLRRQGYYGRGRYGRRYRRCRRWRNRCRRRWGYGWRYRRCMRRHGCARF